MGLTSGKMDRGSLESAEKERNNKERRLILTATAKGSARGLLCRLACCAFCCLLASDRAFGAQVGNGGGGANWWGGENV